MYEFRTKLQHNMTLCQGLLPADFELNHLAKWVLSVERRGGKCVFEIILMERWDLCILLLFDEVLLCMASNKTKQSTHYEIGNVSFVITNGFFFLDQESQTNNL